MTIETAVTKFVVRLIAFAHGGASLGYALDGNAGALPGLVLGLFIFGVITSIPNAANRKR